MLIKEYIAAIRDHYQFKYVSYYEALKNFNKTRNISYKILSVNDLKLYKKSDTLFILWKWTIIK